MQFEKVEPQKIKVSTVDMERFKLDGSVTIAGKKMPFPIDKFPKTFGDTGTIWTYKCEGDELVLNAEVSGIEKLTYRMQRTN